MDKLLEARVTRSVQILTDWIADAGWYAKQRMDTLKLSLHVLTVFPQTLEALKRIAEGYLSPEAIQLLAKKTLEKSEAAQ